ncbi:hypothetical protein [Halorarius halobius]|uniref:hypothetical protein n=1 Tax=Halorarius halobius TaxID=2962671 RepID=UPI0020CBB6A7|nr:hypothetical protein [Halorarius halobius]
MTTTWRWDDELAGPPTTIPESWSRLGHHEPVEPYQREVYAVEVRLGPLLLWTVDDAGNPVDGPHQDKPAARVVYATADGKRALERVYDAERGRNGWTPEREEFVATTGVAPEDLSKVQRKKLRDTFASIVDDRYRAQDSGGDRSERLVADGGIVDRLSNRDLASCPECDTLLNVNVSPEGTRYRCCECNDWIPTKEVIR